jgi:outer membrane protein assembly factor BamB
MDAMLIIKNGRVVLSHNLKIKNMKKIISVFIYVFYLLIIVGCKTGNKQANNLFAENIIEINLSTNKNKVLYSELFDSLKYICLETTDDILIKEITRLKYVDEKIYILDKRSQTVFCFDMGGKLCWKIHSLGQGPQEYTQLTDFDIDKENNKLYLFSFRDKILVYDLSGNFIKEYNTELGGKSFAYNKGQIYIYADTFFNEADKSGENNYLFLFNENKDTLEGKFPFNIDKRYGSTITYNSSNAFCHYEGEVRFFIPFSNNVYSIKGDSIYIKYHFDFGEYNLPDNYFDNYTTNDIRESKYAYGLNSFWENDKYYSFNIYVNQEFYQVLYSKKEDKVYIGTLYDDMSYCCPSFSNVTDDYILGSLSVEDLLLIHNLPKEDNQNLILEKIISEVTEDDNPAIFLCYFKKINLNSNEK